MPYQNLGIRRNIDSVLGPNPLLWCWPGVKPQGNGLKYPLAEGNGKWVEFSMRRNEGGVDKTYGIDGDYQPEP